MSDSDHCKVVMIGSSGVGKTALVERISSSEFNDVHIPTVGAQFVSLEFKTDTGKVNIELWDTAGQEVFRSLVGFYARDAKGAFLVVDLTSRSALDELEKWVEFIKENTPDSKIILFGNKTDLVNERVVSESDLAKFADTHSYIYFEGSAKTGENVYDAFARMALLVNNSNPSASTQGVQLVDNNNQEKKGCC